MVYMVRCIYIYTYIYIYIYIYISICIYCIAIGFYLYLLYSNHSARVEYIIEEILETLVLLRVLQLELEKVNFKPGPFLSFMWYCMGPFVFLEPWVIHLYNNFDNTLYRIRGDSEMRFLHMKKHSLVPGIK